MLALLTEKSNLVFFFLFVFNEKLEVIHLNLVEINFLCKLE